MSTHLWQEHVKYTCGKADLACATHMHVQYTCTSNALARARLTCTSTTQKHAADARPKHMWTQCRCTRNMQMHAQHICMHSTHECSTCMPAQHTCAHAQEMDAKARSSRLDHWLSPNIIVKVMSKELKEAGYYKQKVSRSQHHCQKVMSKELKEAGYYKQKKGRSLGRRYVGSVIVPHIYGAIW